MNDGIPQAVGDILLEHPEKLLESSFVTTLNPTVAELVCQLFGRSIETVFFWPAIILLVAAPLGFCIPVTKGE
jgi:hypothetical protein